MTRVDVLIVGAGMSGILMGRKLLQAGIRNFVILEKGDEIGGTWRDNTYPGIACDVPCHLYSYEDEPNPDWSTLFPKGGEILAYLKRCADKWGVTSFIRGGSEVVSAGWTGADWSVVTSDGGRFSARAVVCATGFLHQPSLPRIEGLESFRGQVVHTARWPAGLDLTGKSVGVIGNGSTAAQLVPAIVDQVTRLTLFQRTPQWMHPADQKAHSDAERAAFRRSPIVQKFLARYWKLMGEMSFTEAVIGVRDAAALDQACRDNLARVEDPELRAALTPDYQPGCKRLVFASAFYGAIQKPNARLVTAPIERITPEGVQTSRGVESLDVLIFATGFQGNAYMRPMAITGAGGVTLEQAWRDGPWSYRGVGLPGFPGLFTLVGPFSPTGNVAIVAVAELQGDYVVRCIERMFERGEAWAPSAEAADRVVAEMREGQKATRWMTGCSSWYQGKDGAIALYPFTFARFEREMTQGPDERDFDKVPVAAPVPA